MLDEASSSKKTLRIWAIFLLGKCWVLHMYHSSDIKPMPEHSKAEKSVKSIVFGNVYWLFGKNRQKYSKLASIWNSQHVLIWSESSTIDQSSCKWYILLPLLKA